MQEVGLHPFEDTNGSMEWHVEHLTLQDGRSELLGPPPCSRVDC